MKETTASRELAIFQRKVIDDNIARAKHEIDRIKFREHKFIDLLGNMLRHVDP